MNGVLAGATSVVKTVPGTVSSEVVRIERGSLKRFLAPFLDALRLELQRHCC
jgi:hypothetical protein